MYVWCVCEKKTPPEKRTLGTLGQQKHQIRLSNPEKHRARENRKETTWTLLSSPLAHTCAPASRRPAVTEGKPLFVDKLDTLNSTYTIIVNIRIRITIIIHACFGPKRSFRTLASRAVTGMPPPPPLSPTSICILVLYSYDC